MADLTLSAQPRELIGKKVSQLRRVGQLPAVIYGPAIAAPQAIQLDAKQFETVYHAAGLTHVIDLAVGDGLPTTVLIREVQYNLLKRAIDHVDFYAANLREQTIVAIPLTLVGEAPVVARGEGVLNQIHTTVRVSALPTAIPSHLEIDLSSVQTVNDDVRVSDLTAPADVTIVDSPDTVLVAVTHVAGVPVEEAAPAEAAAESSKAEAEPATEETTS